MDLQKQSSTEDVTHVKVERPEQSCVAHGQCQYAMGNSIGQHGRYHGGFYDSGGESL